MKRIIIGTITLFLSATFVDAQDIITKKDGTDIEAKVLEVNPSDVKYKRFDNLEGPTYSIDRTDILMIRYVNGTNEVFNVEQSSPVQGQDNHRLGNDLFFASNPELIDVGMKYRDIKRYYNKNDYDALLNPQYSASRAWMNLIIPGLAQFTMGEGGLGCRYLFASLASDLMVGITWGLYQAGEEPCTPIFFTGLISALITEIASISNASKVAKIKSLYSSDMVKMYKGYSFTVAPVLSPTYSPEGFQVVPGLNMRVSF